jgi:hypothetical protein
MTTGMNLTCRHLQPVMAQSFLVLALAISCYDLLFTAADVISC